MQQSLLCLLYIRQYCAGGPNSQREMGAAETLQRGNFKVCEQTVTGIILGEIASIVGGDVPGNTCQYFGEWGNIILIVLFEVGHFGIGVAVAANFGDLFFAHYRGEPAPFATSNAAVVCFNENLGGPNAR